LNFTTRLKSEKKRGKNYCEIFQFQYQQKMRKLTSYPILSDDGFNNVRLRASVDQKRKRNVLLESVIDRLEVINSILRRSAPAKSELSNIDKFVKELEAMVLINLGGKTKKRTPIKQEAMVKRKKGLMRASLQKKKSASRLRLLKAKEAGEDLIELVDYATISAVNLDDGKSDPINPEEPVTSIFMKLL